MKKHPHAFTVTALLTLILLVSVACGTLELGIEEPTALPQTQVVSTATAPVAPASADPEATGDLGHSTPNALGSPTPQVAVLPTRTPYVVPSYVNLSGSIYFLPATHPASSGENRSVWRLDSGASEIVRITSPELDITSFDIWPGDGRMAYGTETGQLYMELPNQDHRLIHDASQDSEEPISITSVAWSPEGARLVFTARSEWSPESLTNPADGLWLLVLGDDRLIRLLANRPAQWQEDTLDVSQLRSIGEPVWSSDGAALMLTALYWEWSDILLLKPVIANPTEDNLFDFSEGWVDGSWALDDRAIYLSGAAYSATADLVRADRDSQVLELLLDGEAEGLYIHSAQELPAGITFLAAPYGGPQQTHLYLGQQTVDGFDYAPAGPRHALCDTGYPTGIAWEPSGQLAVLTCSRGVYLISLDGMVDLDLSPFLGQLAGENQLKVAWGPSG